MTDFKNNANLIKKDSVKSIIFNIRIFNKALTALIIISAVSYVLCVNNLSIKGFELTELKKKSSQLEVESKRYDLEMMQLKSLVNINKRVEKMNMVSVDKINYIKGNNIVVVNK